MKSIKLTQRSTNDNPYRHSKCGEWATNGHWMYRLDCATESKALEPIDQTPDASSVVPGDVSGYRRIESAEINVQGCGMWMELDGAPLTVWLADDYTAMAIKADMQLWAKEPHLPVIVTKSTCTLSLYTIVGLIMPQQAPDVRSKAAERLASMGGEKKKAA